MARTSNKKFKIVEWSRTKQPRDVGFFNYVWEAQLYKFFRHDILLRDPTQIKWSIEDND